LRAIFQMQWLHADSNALLVSDEGPPRAIHWISKGTCAKSKRKILKLQWERTFKDAARWVVLMCMFPCKNLCISAANISIKLTGPAQPTPAAQEKIPAHKVQKKLQRHCLSQVAKDRFLVDEHLLNLISPFPLCNL